MYAFTDSLAVVHTII